MSPQPVNRLELRYYTTNWKAYAERFGHLDLRKNRWETMKTADLARFLRSKGVEVSRAREGNPSLSLRLAPQLLAWVERNGGGEMVRAKLEQAAVAELGAAAYGWERGKTVRTFRLQGRVEDQREFVLWKRGQASFLFLSPESEPERTAKGYRSEREAREVLGARTGCEIVDGAAQVAPPVTEQRDLAFSERLKPGPESTDRSPDSR